MPAEKSEPKLTEATRKTAAALAGLQSRLGPVAAEPNDDLSRELQEYFSAPAPTSASPDDLRERVIDGVVERILRSWDEPELKGAVLERLVERVVQRLSK
jgi:hypothetical protein